VGEGQRQDPGTYKSTNSFLHDLHTLHQHRFDNPSNHPTLLSLSLSSQPRLPSSAPTWPLQSPSWYCQSNYYSTFAKSPILERSGVSPPDQGFIAQSHHGEGMTVGELRRVTERYEDTNRCVLFILSVQAVTDVKTFA
jgi:hypothetical protein